MEETTLCMAAIIPCMAATIPCMEVTIITHTGQAILSMIQVMVIVCQNMGLINTCPAKVDEEEMA